MSMVETDWVNVQSIDDPDFFQTINTVHWHEDPSRHLKGQRLYNACLDVMSSNVNNDICSLLTKHCKVCQVVVQRYKKNKKEEVTEERNTFVHVNVLHLDIVFNEDMKNVLTHIVTIVYNNGFTEFIPINEISKENISGHLYHSFSSNLVPCEMNFVFASGSSTDRNANGKDIKHSLVE